MKNNTASADGGAIPDPAHNKLLAVADMLDAIDAMIAAKRYDEAEAKLAEAKAMLAAGVTALAMMAAAAFPTLSALIEQHRAAEAVFSAEVDAMERAWPEKKSVDIPGISKPVSTAAGPDAMVRDVGKLVDDRLDDIAHILKLYPDLVDAIRSRLETEKQLAVARVEEVFAGYRVAEAAYNNANEAAEGLLLQICAFRCTSLEEVATKVRYLAGLGNMLEPDQGAAFYSSFLPEGEKVEPFL
jgi:hypothetical protein